MKVRSKAVEKALNIDDKTDYLSIKAVRVFFVHFVEKGIRKQDVI